MTTRTTVPRPNPMPSGPAEEDGTTTYTTGTQPSEGYPGGEGTPVGSIPVTPTVSEAGSYVNPATDTVAGQLDALLQSGSPLMQRAANFADVQSQRKGLLGSSMAAGAAQGAMMDRALPIAQQDASTYAGFSKAQQDFDMTNSINQTAHQYQQEIMDKDWDLNTRTLALGMMDSMTKQFMTEAGAMMRDENVTQTQMDTYTAGFNSFMKSMFDMADYGFEWVDVTL